MTDEVAAVIHYIMNGRDRGSGGFAVSRILVVEDDPSLRTVIRMVLERGGFEVEEAPHGQAALEQLAGGGQDLVLVDLNMPRMGGLELMDRMRSNEKTASVPVVLLSGRHDAAAAAQAADGLVTKPFEPEELVRTIRGIIDSRAESPR